MRPLLLAILLLGCSGSSSSPNGKPEGKVTRPPAGACVETYAIEFTPGTTFDDVAPDATRPWPQPGVTFAATVARSGNTAHVEGVLTNNTDAAATVDYLTGGATGISTNPFQVDIDAQPRTATGPEIYPTPRRAVLPARGNITYRADRCPTFPARVRWTFSPWRGTATTGDVLLE